VARRRGCDTLLRGRAGGVLQLQTTVPFAALTTICRLDARDVFILIAISGWRGIVARVDFSE
jgi:hypothetical protein